MSTFARSGLFLSLAAASVLGGCGALTGATSGTTTTPPAPIVASGEIMLQVAWGMALAELQQYAALPTTSAAAKAFILKGLPALQAEITVGGQLQPGVSPQKIAADIAAFINGLPAGTIGTADMLHVQAIAAAAEMILGLGA